MQLMLNFNEITFKLPCIVSVFFNSVNGSQKKSCETKSLQPCKRLCEAVLRHSGANMFMCSIIFSIMFTMFTILAYCVNMLTFAN